MTFSLKRFWLSLPKNGDRRAGLTALTPDGVGSVRDSASVSLMPVKLRNQSFPRIGRSPLSRFWLYGSSVAPFLPIGARFRLLGRARTAAARCASGRSSPDTPRDAESPACRSAATAARSIGCRWTLP